MLYVAPRRTTPKDKIEAALTGGLFFWARAGASMAQWVPTHKPHTGAKKHKPSKRQRTTREKRYRDNSTARGYDTRWEKFRLTKLGAQPLCEYCLAQGRVTPATVLDHDIPHSGDTYLFWNNTYTSLCATHHSGTKQRLERRYGSDHDGLLRAIAEMKGLPPELPNK